MAKKDVIGKVLAEMRDKVTAGHEPSLMIFDSLADTRSSVEELYDRAVKKLHEGERRSAKLTVHTSTKPFYGTTFKVGPVIEGIHPIMRDRETVTKSLIEKSLADSVVVGGPLSSAIDRDAIASASKKMGEAFGKSLLGLDQALGKGKLAPGEFVTFSKSTRSSGKSMLDHLAKGGAFDGPKASGMNDIYANRIRTINGYDVTTSTLNGVPVVIDANVPPGSCYIVEGKVMAHSRADLDHALNTANVAYQRKKAEEERPSQTPNNEAFGSF